MDDNHWLEMRFDESRAHLRAVVYRMLQSASEAEDAIHACIGRSAGVSAML